MTIIRKPAVAGRFYPGDPRSLRTAVRGYLDSARANVLRSAESAPPKGIIVPHAGYVYSGPIAASAYACLEPHRGAIRCVVLMGPSHFVPVRGLAACHADVYETPLGNIQVDTQAIEQLLGLPQVEMLDAAHAREHSLEVHLPFLQETLGEFLLVPLAVGNATADEVAEVIDRLWDDETLFVISSDLSHFHDYDTGRKLDRETCQVIEELRLDDLRGDRACGFKPISGMLNIARKKGLAVRLLDLRSSGDTGGDRSRVVGYGAFVVEPQSPRAAPRGIPPGAAGGLCLDFELVRDDARALLEMAASSVAEGLMTGRPLAVDVNHYSPPLRQSRATFVTLRAEGRLRGCMGAIRATEALVVDVSRNAYSAAFRDPRFSPVTREELERLEYHISILSEPVLLEFESEADLLAQLRPGIDGLVLYEGSKKGTLLPAVWDHLAEPADFLAQLKLKAGLPRDYWSDSVRVERYVALSVHAD